MTLKSLIQEINSLHNEINNLKEQIKNCNIEIIKYKIDCDKIPDIKKQDLLGEGSFGAVYKHCLLSTKGESICKYAVKIQRKYSFEDTYKKLRDEQLITNKLHKYGLAPKIHKIVDCGDEFMILMDLVEGKTVAELIENGDLNKDKVNKLFECIEYMHTIAKHSHGDLNPKNIIYNDGKFTFVDISPENKDRPAYYDYGTIIAYLPNCKYIQHLSDDIINLIYSKIYDKLKDYIYNKNEQKAWNDILNTESFKCNIELTDSRIRKELSTFYLSITYWSDLIRELDIVYNKINTVYSCHKNPTEFGKMFDKLIRDDVYIEEEEFENDTERIEKLKELMDKINKFKNSQEYRTFIVGYMISRNSNKYVHA